MYTSVVINSNADIHVNVQYNRDSETVPSAQEVSKFSLGDFFVFKKHVVQEDAYFGQVNNLRTCK